MEEDKQKQSEDVLLQMSRYIPRLRVEDLGRLEVAFQDARTDE